jgi:mannosyltransferase
MRDFSELKKISVLLCFVLLGFLLRTYDLGRRDLWFDEALSVSGSQKPSRLLSPADSEQLPYGNPALHVESSSFKKLDPQPPFYYVLLNIWIRLFGDSEFSVRFLSVIWGVLSIPLIYLAGKNLINKSTGLVAAALLSIAPLHIWYAQEARGYTLSVFLVLLVFYFFQKSYQDRKNKSWLSFLATMILALYTNYFSVLMPLAGWFFVLFRRDKVFLRQWLAVNVILAAAFLPWLPALMQQLDFVKSVFWIPKPTLASLVITLENLHLGYTAPQVAFSLSLFVSGGLFGLGAYRLKKEGRSMPLVFFILPVFIVFVVSKKWPIYIDRQLMLFSSFYYLVVAAGLSRIKSFFARFLISLLIFSGITVAMSHYYADRMPVQSLRHHLGAYIKEPFLPVINFIERHWMEEDLLVYGHISVLPSFEYYKKRLGLRQSSRNIYDHKRIWLISSSWPRDGKLEPGTELLRSRLGEYYNRKESFSYKGVILDLLELDKNRARKAIENQTVVIAPVRISADLLRDIHDIKMTVAHTYADFAGQDMEAMLQRASRSYAGHSSDDRSMHANTYRQYAKLKLADFFRHNILFYVTNLIVDDLQINGAIAEAAIFCGFERFNITTNGWLRKTFVRKTRFIREDDEWKIYSTEEITPGPMGGLPEHRIFNELDF